MELNISYDRFPVGGADGLQEAGRVHTAARPGFHRSPWQRLSHAFAEQRMGRGGGRGEIVGQIAMRVTGDGALSIRRDRTSRRSPSQPPPGPLSVPPP